MLVKFSGVESERTISKVKKKEDKIFLGRVHLLHKAGT